ncbi:hypothetical protein CHARACLAT_028925 [Characodon lateralis]|uniref:Uncharacterized protein n=1 Tax=Characodon lateralis TaxID=208331 RepID=A0ABU7DAW3_9TELE|nr:hypothetical protein [Characodon lateralis]
MASQHDASITMYLGSSVSLWVKMSKMLAHVVYCKPLPPRDCRHLCMAYGILHFLLLPFNNGCLLATLSKRPSLWSARLILSEDSPTRAVDLHSSSRVTISFFD